MAKSRVCCAQCSSFAAGGNRPSRRLRGSRADPDYSRPTTTEEQASPVAAMGLYLEAARDLSGEAHCEEECEPEARHLRSRCAFRSGARSLRGSLLRLQSVKLFRGTMNDRRASAYFWPRRSSSALAACDSWSCAGQSFAAARSKVIAPLR